MTRFGTQLQLHRLLRWLPCWNFHWLLRRFSCRWFKRRGSSWFKRRVCRCHWSPITTTTCTTRRLGCQSSMGIQVTIGAVRVFHVPKAIELDAVTVKPSTFVSTTRISYGWSVSRISPLRDLAFEEVVANTDT